MVEFRGRLFQVRHTVVRMQYNFSTPHHSYKYIRFNYILREGVCFYWPIETHTVDTTSCWQWNRWPVCADPHNFAPCLGRQFTFTVFHVGLWWNEREICSSSALIFPRELFFHQNSVCFDHWDMTTDSSFAETYYHQTGVGTYNHPAWRDNCSSP